MVRYTWIHWWNFIFSERKHSTQSPKQFRTRGQTSESSTFIHSVNVQEILLIQKKLTIFKAKSLHITRITLNYRTYTKLYEPQERSEVPPLVITFCISTCVRICFFGSNFSFSSIFFCVEKERTRRPFYSPRSKLVAYLTSFLQRYQHFWRSVFVNLSLFLSLSVEWNVSTTISMASSWKLRNS